MTISELVESAEKRGFRLKARTIYFYSRNDLLPSVEVGRGARYNEMHLLHLLLIKELQEKHYKLSEIGKQIKAELHGKTKEQKHALLERLSVAKETVPVRDVQDLGHYLNSAHSKFIASREALQNAAAENSQQADSEPLSVSYADLARPSPRSAKSQQASHGVASSQPQDQTDLRGVSWIKFSPQEGIDVQIREDVLRKNRRQILLWLAEYALTNSKGDRHED